MIDIIEIKQAIKSGEIELKIVDGSIYLTDTTSYERVIIGSAKDGDEG